ncbi:MAG: hypothetical protein COB53_03455 [Elusimicrobia bacterium]|nr:MAG: hypothetical protein COB53_03455 [Elusimicrobiota bacterium]
MEHVRTTKDFLVPIAPDQLWPVFSDTDRINRAIDLTEVVYDEAPSGEVVRTAHSKLLGFLSTSWEEPPYEFVAERYYSIFRKMHGGPFASYSFSVQFEAEGDGTRVELCTDIDPRNAFFAWLGKKASKGILDKMAEGLTGFAGAVSAGKDNIFAPKKSQPEIDRHHLAELTKKIRPKVGVNILDKIETHLSSASDRDVLGMRPFELADAWHCDRVKTLRAFLHGSIAGLFNLSWEILCPNCRVAKADYNDLSDLESPAHCDTCEINFDGEFDKNVELRFSVHPSIREAAHADFCIGSPAKSLHRKVQARLGPGQSRTFQVHLKNRRFFLRGLKDDGRLVMTPDASASELISIAFEKGCAVGEGIRFKPGPVSITMENRSESECWVVVDGEDWADLGATAAFVTTLQDFRDLFSSEVLAPNQKLAIKNLAIVFTDLKDSTQIYAKIGDAKAYALVRRHFNILIAAMRDHNGGIVKTIGDAVMAGFTSTPDAVAAGIAIQHKIAEYNRDRDPGSLPIIVKLGIHAGPAIAVTMNEHLDYFGTTVNTAARVEGASQGDDIVLTEEVLECPGVRDHLTRDGGTLEEFEVELKGLSTHYRLWRFSPKSATIRERKTAHGTH